MELKGTESEQQHHMRSTAGSNPGTQLLFWKRSGSLFLQNCSEAVILSDDEQELTVLTDTCQTYSDTKWSERVQVLTGSPFPILVTKSVNTTPSRYHRPHARTVTNGTMAIWAHTQAEQGSTSHRTSIVSDIICYICTLHMLRK